MKHHPFARLTLALLCLTLTLSLLPRRAEAAFGLTSDSNFYTVDTEGGLVFKVRRTDNGASTQSAGDIASMVYNGVEYQNPSRGSQLNSGFDFLYSGVSAVAVSASIVNTDYIKVTVEAGDLTHYYMARRGYPHIYMATYFTTEPDTLGLCRYIVRIPAVKLPNGPTPSDIRGTTSTVEASDIFRLPNGETRSKHYSNMRLIDWSYIGATGTDVGVFMVRDNQEGGSGGPFYRSLLNQCGTDQEITYIVNYGEAQTEAFRTSVLNGPYTLTFTNGEAPTTPDTSWLAGLGLRGYVSDAGRGKVQGRASGIPSGFEGVVGWANAKAQYACKVNADGNFSGPAMIPGDYTMTLYKGELAVATDTVSVTAGATVSTNIASQELTYVSRFRIGAWDGTPYGLLNADKVTTMHPSDVRMSPWGPVTYTVGSSVPGDFPAYQWKGVNNPTTIKFDLTAAQIAAHTLRVGLTTAFSGGRPQVAVNSWTSSIPAPSSQPSSRTLTVGTYRGNNVTYTYNIPASAFVAGTNTMTLTVVSGSGGAGFLSPGYSYDAVELDTTDPGTLPPTGGITVTPTSGLTTNEGGGTATFTAVLNSAPKADVRVGLSSSDATEGAVSPTSLSFTSLNWDTPQTVIVTGLPDRITDGPQPYSIITAPAESADADYSGLNALDVSVTNIDDATLPVISITAPTSPKSNITSFPTISGTASDSGTGVRLVKVRLQRATTRDFWNGTAWTRTEVLLPAIYNPGTKAWQTSGPLPSGANLSESVYDIKAYAQDGAQNVATTSRGVNVNPVAPRISITAPALTLSGATQLPAIGGQIADTGINPSGVKLVKFRLQRTIDNRYWNGTSWGTSSVMLPAAINLSHGTWQSSGLLPSGANLSESTYKIIAYAQDRAGNTGSSAIRSISVNMTKPLIVIDAPGASLNGISAFPTMSGRAADTQGVNPSGLRLVKFRLIRLTSATTGEFWNGSSWGTSSTLLPVTLNLSNGNWQSNVALPSGTNLTSATYRIIAYAQDKAGNVGSTSRDVAVTRGAGA